MAKPSSRFVAVNSTKESLAASFAVERVLVACTFAMTFAIPDLAQTVKSSSLKFAIAAGSEKRDFVAVVNSIPWKDEKEPFLAKKAAIDCLIAATISALTFAILVTANLAKPTLNSFNAALVARKRLPQSWEKRESHAWTLFQSATLFVESC